MGVGFTDSITVTLLPRVLGHGGFASSEIHISYLDRNYAANDFGVVLHHEMIHILDARLGGEFRPSIFVEGLAVYLTGGHFKEEPILSRGAALLDLGEGWYIPLQTLADDFYLAQHEIGYLQGGALVAYMVETWGWENFQKFYRAIRPIEGGTVTQAVQAALEEHFGIGFSQLEREFLAYLRRQPFTPADREDLRLSVLYFDVLREYQQAYDPSAYFATAWLLDTAEMRQRGIVTDYLRHPEAEINREIENALIDAYGLILAGQYPQAEEILLSVREKLRP
jgi:hypothetical protein